MNYTYIVRCKDGSLYTGWTNDIEKRIKAHNEGKGAKYTRAHKPVKVAWQMEFDTKSEALKAECKIKNMTHEQKIKLVNNENTLIALQ